VRQASLDFDLKAWTCTVLSKSLAGMTGDSFSQLVEESRCAMRSARRHRTKRATKLAIGAQRLRKSSSNAPDTEHWLQWPSVDRTDALISHRNNVTKCVLRCNEVRQCGRDRPLQKLRMVGRWWSWDVGPAVSVATTTVRLGIRRPTTAVPLSATLHRGRRYRFAGARSHRRSNLATDRCDQQQHDRLGGVRSNSEHGSPGSNHTMYCRDQRLERLERYEVNDP
jgi:hypothetical protein